MSTITIKRNGKDIELREIEDVDEQKRWIERRVTDAFSNKAFETKKVRLEMSNVKIQPREYDKEAQKKALLSKRNLSQPVYADVKLVDKESGQTIDSAKKKLIAQLPYHTGRNTVISNGSYFTPHHQIRLRPGAYTRRKTNGELETHFNLISGSGSGFRVNLDPESGVFNFQLGSSNTKLYPLMKAMGASDGQLRDAWGDEILKINQDKSKGDADIAKLHSKLVPYGNPNSPISDKVVEVVDTLSRARMDPDVNKFTLGKPYSNVDANVLTEATKKIIKVNKGEEESDFRDSLQFKGIHSIEDFYAEKIEKDAGDIGKALVRKLERKPDLKKYMPNSYFSRHLWGTIKSDPSVSPRGTLNQPIEEINPIDLYDMHHKVTIMGEGGIGDKNVVTMEARNVHPSQFGFIDYIRTPESDGVGIDQRLAYRTRKGSDNQLYAEFKNVKTGKKEWLSPLDAITKTIAFPDEMKRKDKKASAVVSGEQKEVSQKDVEYELPTHADAFSTYNNIVPMLPSIQGNRAILASKGISTALPLTEGEAPLVQSLNPYTGRSFEKDIGDKVMNVTAKDDGIVHRVTKNNIFVRNKSGKVVRHGMYDNFPLNLKTRLHNKVQIEKGAKVKKGDLLATSNYTDNKGELASGVNLISTYMPYFGNNFEDGQVISESAAKKLTSEQMYSHEYKVDDPKQKVVDRKKFQSLFPSLFPNKVYENMDDTGVVKPGTILKKVTRS